MKTNESEFGGKLRVLAYTADGFPIVPICGAEGPGGYSTAGDILTTLGDGTDLNAMWAEFQQALAIRNEQRDIVARHLTFGTVRPLDAVAQAVEQDGFQLASEFGDPTSMAAKPELVKMGYDFQDWDLRIAMTWKFLRSASQAEVETLFATAIADDNKNVNTAILRRLLSPTAGVNDEGNAVYPLYNGDAMVPPRSGFNTHTASHTHYLTTGSTAPDGEDLDVMVNHIEHHGYLNRPGARLLLFVHSVDMPAIRAIRAGVSGADNDFIPSADAPAYLTDQTIVGSRAPGELNGLRIVGSYGDVWIAPTPFMAPGWMLMVATGGPNDPFNPVGFREFPLAGQQGLRLLPGNQQRYPLIESYYTRGFGVGVRHRGAAVAMQITTNGTYAAPTL